MKNLKEHSPNPDSWGKIVQRSDFESQLGSHLSQLPLYSPNEDAWERITLEMDRKKTIPIWIKWGVAASLLGFLLVGGMALNNLNSDVENKTQDLVTESNSEPAEKERKESTLESSQSASPTVTTIEFPQEASTPEKPVSRKVELIEIPKINLPEVKPNHLNNLSLSLPEEKISEPSKLKTLHEVSISWSKHKPGLQIKTSFGRNEGIPSPQPQASTPPPRPLILEINN
ncbi:MAG TPA: hypothetical protein VLA71_03545 [Algoriphagus sp.]|nr:hypothetical protein [Algoriphagus sp.]